MIEKLLDKTLSVYRLTRTSDDQGGWVESYDYDFEVIGRVSQRSARERELAGSEYAEISHVVYTKTPLRRGDRLEVDAGDEVLTLEVIAMRNPSLLGHHYEHDCKEIQRETAG